MFFFKTAHHSGESKVTYKMCCFCQPTVLFVFALYVPNIVSCRVLQDTKPGVNVINVIRAKKLYKSPFWQLFSFSANIYTKNAHVKC